VSQLAIGVDIGGTNMRAALVDPAGRIIHHERQRSRIGNDAIAYADEIVGLVESVVANAGFSMAVVGGVGIGIPGWIDRWTGELVLAPKFASCNGRVLQERLQERFARPVSFDSDPHVATLGELWQGAGRGALDFVMITLGTGIGCGIVLGGRLYSGHHGFGPEFGHMIVGEVSEIVCACGVRGCLESLASGPAIGQAGRRAAQEGQAPRLLERASGVAERITAETVVACAAEGDEASVAILQRAGQLIGTACANVVSLLEPERIVVGGGLSEVGEILLGPIRQTMQRCCYLIAQGYVSPEFRVAQLGDRAGVVGAARLAYDHMT
jgi:glucokinase